ncbi:hypothetical protein D3C73_1594900 [compost metagenome]
MLSNSLNEVKGTTQRFSTPIQRFQCEFHLPAAVFMFRTLVVPLSGSIFNSVSKSTGLPFSRSLSARLAAAS